MKRDGERLENIIEKINNLPEDFQGVSTRFQLAAPLYLLNEVTGYILSLDNGQAAEEEGNQSSIADDRLQEMLLKNLINLEQIIVTGENQGIFPEALSGSIQMVEALDKALAEKRKQKRELIEEWEELLAEHRTYLSQIKKRHEINRRIIESNSKLQEKLKERLADIEEMIEHQENLLEGGIPVDLKGEN